MGERGRGKLRPYADNKILYKNMRRENIAWVDVLRIVACLLVVVAHCCDPFVAGFDTNPSDFYAGVFWGSFVRPCVPLFVMISGLLLLPVDMSMGTFYRKRLSRVVFPLIFWAIVTPIIYYFYVNYIGANNPAIAADSYTLSATTNKIVTSAFNFNYDITPLWYIYMLVGIYLFLPIISAWLREAPKKDIKVFLYIWGFSMCIPYLEMLAPMLGYEGNYGSMGLFGVSYWNAYGTFYYFSGFLGYVILAYYLKRFPLQWSMKKTLAIAIPLFAAGYAVTAGGFLVTQQYFPGNYAALEIVWYFSGINVFAMTFAAYILLQKVKVRSSPMLTRIAGLTFGVYLCHFFIVQVFYDLLYSVLPLPAALKIPTIGICAFVTSMGVVWLIAKLPLRKYIVG